MNPLRDPAIGIELTPREVQALATRTDRAELIERALTWTPEQRELTVAP